MNVILPLCLVLLSLGGGCVGTYFVMDAPRRRAREQLEKLDRRLRQVDAHREELDRREWKLDAQASQLRTTAAQVNLREQQLAARGQEFDRRAVRYAELENENRLLRVELRNAAVHAAYLAQVRQADKAGQSAAAAAVDQLGRAYFDEVAAAAKKAVTASTLPQNNERVRAAAEWVRSVGADLTPNEEQEALAALRTQFEKAVRAQQERERQAELRERVREEQQRQREVEKAEEDARKAERERQAIAAALEKALADAAGHHAAEVDKLRAQLAEAEARSKRALSLAQQTKVGNVYVISNLGSFGEGVFKIGMSRRLDPMERVKELGDASVPFPFDVHLMITCDDAPALENALHKEFSHRRLNRVNLRKEFFRVPLAEIVAAVERHHGTVEYTADAEAIEYRNSLLATDADVDEIEQAYAASGWLNADPERE